MHLWSVVLLPCLHGITVALGNTMQILYRLPAGGACIMHTYDVNARLLHLTQ